MSKPKPRTLYVCYAERSLFGGGFKDPEVHELHFTETQAQLRIERGESRHLGYKTVIRKEDLERIGLAETPEDAIRLYLNRCRLDLEAARRIVEQQEGRLAAALSLAERSGLRM